MTYCHMLNYPEKRLRAAHLPERLGRPWKLADRAELLVLVLRKMFWCRVELDLRPTTSRRSDKFILAVTSPLLSPVCSVNVNLNKA